MDELTAIRAIKQTYEPMMVDSLPFYSNTIVNAVIEKLSIGIVILDFQGTILYFNPRACECFPTLLCEKKWVEIIESEIGSADFQRDTLLLKNQRAIQLRTQSLDPYPAQLICIWDVTDNIELEKQALHQQRLAALGKMAASIAHQIRTPLSTALLYVKNLLDFHGKSEPLQEKKFVEKIYNSLSHIESQIRDMLFFSKGTSIVKNQIPFVEFVNLLKEANSENRVLFFSDEKNNTHLFCNVDLLLGAIQGCINNAIEAQPSGEIVEVLITVKHNILEILVHDHGNGIPEGLKDKVFEAFFTTKEKGTGLGLSIAELVAKSHGGKLNISSKNDDGATIIFELPIILESKNE